MKTRLCSFDTSTNASGVATFDNGLLVDYQLFDFSKNKDTESRINQMGKALLQYLKKQKPDIIWIEHPQGNGRNVSMVGKLCEIIGIVRAYAIEKKIDFHELMPSEWRKYCGIKQGSKNRNELKQLSINYVKEKLGIDVNNDVADAISIGYGVINYYNELKEVNDG